MSIQRLSNAGQSGYRYKTLIAGITPIASVPTIGTATALTYSTASVEFTAPGAYAGSTYTATSSPGGLTGTSASSPITVSGLSAETAYTFTVTATNATGTSGASAASNSITTPAAYAPESGYDSLANVTLSASTSTITFAGIPSGYKHLQIRSLSRTDRSDTNDFMTIRFNDDSSSVYAYHSLYGSGSSAGGGDTGTSTGTPWSGVTAGGNAGSSMFGAAVVDVLDYSATTKYKTTRLLSGTDQNGTTGRIYFQSNLWRSTSAITSITIIPTYGTNFVTNSSFALYGVK